MLCPCPYQPWDIYHFPTVSLVSNISSTHIQFPYCLFLWAVHLWCPLHRIVFTISLNGYHLEYSFIVHLFSLSTVLLFSTAVWPLLICTLGFCILFKNKIFFFFFTCSDLFFFNAFFFSSTVSQFLRELAERVGENITEWKLWWSSEISVLLYYTRKHLYDVRRKVLATQL